MEKYDFKRLKEQINLAQFAASYGYQLDQPKSTRSSLVMRHSNGDKIIVSKKGRVWVYFSVTNDTDNGTVVDFVKNRSQKSLPDIGRELSAWSGYVDIVACPDIQEQVYDRARIKRAFGLMKPAIHHLYLIQERKIPLEVLHHPCFCDRIFQDRYGNAVFPHQDENGVCGLELKNTDKGVFMRGSEKALWLANINPLHTALVLAESSIDALSHFALFRLENASYGAVSGGMKDKQFTFLLSVIEKMPALGKIILAVDHDQGGEKIAGRIEDFLTGKFQGAVLRHTPEQNGQDWNDVLKNQSG